MQAFLDQLEAINPILPSIVRTIIIVAAIVVAWVVISIPAYWIAHALAEPLDKLSAALGKLRNSMMEMTRRLFIGRDKPVEQFAVVHSQTFSFSEENERISQDFLNIGVTIKTIPSKLSGLEAAIVDAQRVTKEAGVAIQRILWPDAVDPHLPVSTVQSVLREMTHGCESSPLEFLHLF
jgi:hypothetical protein